MQVIAKGLHALGVRRGDAVGIMLENRPEFFVIDTAAQHLGTTLSPCTTRCRRTGCPRTCRRWKLDPGH
ncbi:AMP-binding protein [Rhodococcus ruber]|uniref:AMP-binding protein n=1 Tax=Rhodococcus ruber TaxID=1830 RepID=UPI003451312B